MKNLTKIFTAVVAGLLAFSCVTDTTEDLGVQIGKSGISEIAVSLENSRTQLGEKADGVYPLYWSEGDAIAVNGVASTALSESYDGKVAAVFSFAQEVAYPLNAVYPAPAAGVVAAEGLLPVTFMATQPYTVGTFASGAAPMYGYVAAPAEGEEAEPLQLNHLAGALRFAVKGTHKLVSMTVAAADGKIAGNFDIDCATGALTAHEDALNSVTVTFGEGLQLTEEAIPIYVAVPAGEYGVYTITLTDTNDETMVVRFNSDFHPVEAGIVKEFAEFLYTPNAGAGPEGELVIVDVAGMKRLAKLSENGMLGNVTSVRVAASIDMSEVADWHGIELFPAITFDGGSEAGYVISGLKAPLFGTVEGATIQNVKLTDVAITETERLYVGSLVCHANGATINNCSAAGTLTYNNTTYTVTKNSNLDETMSIGGMAGLLVDTSATNCTNEVNITINQFYATSSTQFYPQVGGLFGHAEASAAPASLAEMPAISNCKNLGNIVLGANVKNNSKNSPALGGVVGGALYVNLTNVTNGDSQSVNTKGNITLEAISYCPYWGGVCGMVSAINVNGAYNYGKLHAKKKVTYNQMAGVIGNTSTAAFITDTAINGAKNYGDLVLAADGAASATYIAGIAGRMQATGDIVGCENHGNISTEASCSGNYYVGGILGDGGKKAFSISTCKNTGNITVNSASVAGVWVGGIVGTLSTDTNRPISGCTNGDATKTPNSISVTLAKSTAGAHVGGIVGNYLCLSLKNSKNYANISLNADEMATAAYVGGVVGSMTKTTNAVLEGCTNGYENTTAPNTISVDVATATVVRVGGVAGECHANTLKDCKNHGNVEVSGSTGTATVANSTKECPMVGGVVGYAYNTSAGVVSGLQNYNLGDTDDAHIAVTITDQFTSANYINLGGIFGYAYVKSVDGCMNNCAVNYYGAANAESSTSNFVGGLGGFINAVTTTSSNGARGDINVGGTVGANIGISGIAAYFIQNSTDCSNAGDLNVSVKSGAALYACAHNYTGSSNKVYTNFTNSGNITVSGTTEANMFVSAGVYSGTPTMSGYTNTGNIHVTSTANSKKALSVGILSRSIGGTLTNCSNSGNVLCEGTSAEAITIAGMGGTAGADITIKGSYTNSGNITCAGIAKDIYIGGIMPALAKVLKGEGVETVVKNTGTISNYITNEDGTIKVAKASGTLYVGGVAANVSAIPSDVTLVNEGNVDVRNAEGAYTTAAYIGGVAGCATKTITGAKMTGDVVAIGFTESAAAPIVGVGMIIGSHRSSTAPQADGCVVGGRLAMEEESGAPVYKVISAVEIKDVDAGGDEYVLPGYLPFWAKIYGGTWAEASATNCDNCTADPSAPDQAPNEA